MRAINLAEKLAMFCEPLRPRTVGQFSGHDLMVVEVKDRSHRSLSGCQSGSSVSEKPRSTISQVDQPVCAAPCSTEACSPRASSHCGEGR
jgi:hypothetical protein